MNIVGVLVRPPHHEPHAGFLDPMCNCVTFCRYGGCEHVEYVKMLDVRLRPATVFQATLPVLQRRGRKRGSTVTKRGAAQADARMRKAELEPVLDRG